MAGTVSISADRLWSVSSRLFYWVLNDIARNTRDRELAARLTEIDRENLGWLGLDDITPGQRSEVLHIIAERLVSPMGSGSSPRTRSRGKAVWGC